MTGIDIIKLIIQLTVEVVSVSAFFASLISYAIYLIYKDLKGELKRFPE